MLEIVQFVLGGFWPFIGALILTTIVFEGTVAVIRAIRSNNTEEE